MPDILNKAIGKLLDRLTVNMGNERKATKNRLQKRLVYNWDGKDATAVEEFFKGFHDKITTSLEPGKENPLTLLEAIKGILDWGGIHNNEDMSGSVDEKGVISLGRYAYYLLLLRDLGLNDSQAPSQRLAGGLGKPGNPLPVQPISNKVAITIMKGIQSDLYPVYCHTSKDLTPLASWTKILAAYKPDEFWIYDSRVAIALRFLNQFLRKTYTPTRYESEWYTPAPKTSDGDGDTRKLQKIIGEGAYASANRRIHASRCYQDYCNLLKKNNNPSLLEKKLFMLGGLLNDLSELNANNNNRINPKYRRDKRMRLALILGDDPERSLNDLMQTNTSQVLLHNFNILMTDVVAANPDRGNI